EPTDITDWKLPCTLPKYSPAFKRRSLTPYKSVLNSPATPTTPSTITTQKTLPIHFNAGSNNYKINTPEPKSLESLTSHHSDSSFEFSSNVHLTTNTAMESKVNPRTPPTITARKTSFSKNISTENANEAIIKENQQEVDM